MCRCYLAHRRLLHAATLDSIRTARVEAAAAARIDWARHLASKDDSLAARLDRGAASPREAPQCRDEGVEGDLKSVWEKLIGESEHPRRALEENLTWTRRPPDVN
jgi:hypothetical protein